ncbi:P-loop NTPase [Actinotalea subterranea]|uniref:nucleotide-binding protein n=1 Tax=Actinotalea subterranea TaxID=2607497 RepID=UPI0011EDC084|nr:ATP-binding protein [Actinotalea subterranea]
MRTLVVASGKGGTGKTTMTAVLVHVAAPSRPLAVADCDVEGSNLPLALSVDVVSRTAFAGRPRAVVDEEVCAGCGVCLDRCRFGALSLSDDGLAVIDPWLCESCGACTWGCPLDAISFEPQQAGEVLVGEGPAGPMVFGLLRPGEDLSGKLVTSVRERVAALADERGVGLVIVDGPPGVGCPTIASITGADGVLAVSEPTLSGEHDLRRLVSLAHQLGVPVKVVLNKADLSETGAQRIRSACSSLGVELVGELDFDTDLPRALGAVARGTRPPSSLDSSSFVHSVRAIWPRVDPERADWALPDDGSG